MKEAKVEDYLKQRVEETGGLVRKVQWIGRRGAPDRLVGWPARPLNFGTFSGRQVMPNAETSPRHVLVETKRPGGSAEAHQRREHERLRSIGFEVLVIDTLSEVDRFVERMTGR